MLMKFIINGPILAVFACASFLVSGVGELIACVRVCVHSSVSEVLDDAREGVHHKAYIIDMLGSHLRFLSIMLLFRIW